MQSSDDAGGSASTRRRPLWATGLVVGLPIALAAGALGLAGYDRLTFSDRVEEYVSAHRSELIGPSGSAGPAGRPGLVGAIGPAAETGPQGDEGEAGERGEQGLQGLPGDRGPAGPQGQPGQPANVACITSAINQWARRIELTTFFGELRLSVPSFNAFC
jgi:hypothetical protein